MTDIVERLREANSDYHNPLMREAANEIDRLRVALQRIVTLCSDDHDRVGIAHIAVTALARGVLR